MEQQDAEPPLRATHGWRTWIILIAMIALADVTLYRSLGYAGPALFFPVAVALLLFGRSRIEWNRTLIVVNSLLILLSASMFWAGGFGQIMAAVWLLIAANLAAQGVMPYLLESTVAMAATVPGGYEFLHGFQLNWRRLVLDPVDHGRPSRAMNILLQSAAPRNSQHWTATQFGKTHALRKLQDAEVSLQQIGTDDKASSALQSFHDYAMQWW